MDFMMSTKLRESMWSFKKVWESALWPFYNLFLFVPMPKLEMTIFVICNCYPHETVSEPIKQPEILVALKVPTNGATYIDMYTLRDRMRVPCMALYGDCWQQPARCCFTLLGPRALHRNPKRVTGAYVCVCGHIHGTPFRLEPNKQGLKLGAWLG
jgi:hypothetical protein